MNQEELASIMRKQQQSLVVLDGTTPDAAEALHQITLEANGGKTTWKVSSFQAELVDPHTLYLGYQDAGQLVGYIGSMLVLDEASINNFAVLPSFKKRGIGTALMRQLLVCCKERDIQTVFLEVRVSNEAAISLYRKFGFEKVAFRKEYYVDPVEDADLFQLRVTDIDSSEQ